MYTRSTMQLFPAALAALCLALAGSALAGNGHHGKAKGMVQKAGDYKIALKLLPAEPFVPKSGAKKAANAGEMVNAGGADPLAKDAASKPNHHLVVFIKKNGKPVKNADVKMSYQKAGSSGEPTELPVTHMWAAGKGKKTTHYGNNVQLSSGDYVVHVTVNKTAKADFNLTVP